MIGFQYKLYLVYSLFSRKTITKIKRMGWQDIVKPHRYLHVIFEANFHSSFNDRNACSVIAQKIYGIVWMENLTSTTTVCWQGVYVFICSYISHLLLFGAKYNSSRCCFHDKIIWLISWSICPSPLVMSIKIFDGQVIRQQRCFEKIDF